MKEIATESYPSTPGWRVLDVDKLGRAAEASANGIGDGGCLRCQDRRRRHVSVKYLEEDRAEAFGDAVLGVLALGQSFDSDPDPSGRCCED